MNVIEHGSWQRYQPTELPPSAPVSALFSHRADDGVDWYDYVNDGSNFRTDTIKMTLFDNVVAAATTDQTGMFPGEGALVLEVTDVPLDDPINDWSRKVYDPATRTFSDPRPLVTEGPTIADLLNRIAVLEAKAGGA